MFWYTCMWNFVFELLFLFHRLIRIYVFHKSNLRSLQFLLISKFRILICKTRKQEKLCSYVRDPTMMKVFETYSYYTKRKKNTQNKAWRPKFIKTNYVWKRPLHNQSLTSIFHSLWTVFPNYKKYKARSSEGFIINGVKAFTKASWFLFIREVCCLNWKW